MKKTIFSTFGLALLLASCTQTGTAGKKMARAEAHAEGKTIFENSCHKCHALPEPKAFTDEQWVGLVNSMAPKAKLTEAQGKLVYDYVAASN